MGNKQSRGRDKHGLLPQQRLVLQEFLSSGSWAEAEKRAGVSPRTFRRWLNTDPNFEAAYNKIFDDRGEVIRKEVAASAGRAAETLDGALDATKGVKVEVECPNCHVMFEHEIAQPVWTARIRAAESILKIGGQLKDVKKIEGSVEMIHMTIAHKVALDLIESGQADRVPAHMVQELQAMGKLDKPVDNEAENEDTIEAEFRRLGDGDQGSGGSAGAKV